MTCDVIEVTTRRGKREEEGFYGLEESGREQQERRLKEENKKRRRRRSGRLPWPLLRGRVRRLSKQVAGFDNNPGWSLVPRPRVSACSPAAIQQLSSKATVVLRKLGGSLDSPSHAHPLTPSPLRHNQPRTQKLFTSERAQIRTRTPVWWEICVWTFEACDQNIQTTRRWVIDEIQIQLNNSPTLWTPLWEPRLSSKLHVRYVFYK